MQPSQLPRLNNDYRGPIEDPSKLPGIDDVYDQFVEKMTDSGRKVEALGMDDNFNLITQEEFEANQSMLSRLSYSMSLSYWTGSETFEGCQERLKQYLDFQAQSLQLHQRKVILNPKVKPLLKPDHSEQPAPLTTDNAGEALGLLRTAYRAGFREYGTIYQQQAHNQPAIDVQNIREGDALLLERFLSRNKGHFPDNTLAQKANRETVRKITFVEPDLTRRLLDLLLTQDMKTKGDRALILLGEIYTGCEKQAQRLKNIEMTRFHNPEISKAPSAARLAPDTDMKTDEPIEPFMDLRGQKTRHMLKRQRPSPFGRNLEEEVYFTNLEYRVVLEPDRVKQKVEKATAEAKTAGEKGADKVKFPESGFLPFVVPDTDPEETKSEVSTKIKDGAAAWSIGCRRTKMEDGHLMTNITFKAGEETITAPLVAVFDGHSNGWVGKQIVKVSARRLPLDLINNLEDLNRGGLTRAGIFNALKIALPDLERALNLKPGFVGGTTVTLCLVIKGELWTVNAGDTRAVLCHKDGSSTQLSEDANLEPAKPREGNPPENAAKNPNKPEYDEEGKFNHSVLKRGGMIVKPDTLRATHPDSKDPAVNMGRSIGDYQSHGAISARGKITCTELKPEHQGDYLVVACDGVFNVASSNQVSRLIKNLREEIPTVCSEALSQQLVSHSLAGGSLDNITALVVPL